MTLVYLSVALFLVPSALSITLHAQLILENPNQSSNARTMAGTASNGPVEFHLHWDGTPGANDRSDLMNTDGPYSPATIDYDTDGIWGITIQRQAPKNYHYWSMTPDANSAVQIQGNLTLAFWGRSDNNNSLMDFDLNLYDSVDLFLGSDTLIGTVSFPGVNTLSSELLYTFNLTGINYTLPAGDNLIVYFGRYDWTNADLYVTFDQSFSDSTCVMDIRSHYSISDGWAEGTEGIRRSGFTDQEPILAYVNVSDSLGAYDIKNASIEVVALSDSSTVYSSIMTIDSIDGSALPAWKLFEETLGPLPIGDYGINVTVSDNTGNIIMYNWTISVITADHFQVSASRTRLVAGEPFNVTIEAMDNTDQRMKNWSGLIMLEAINQVPGPLGGGLSNGSIMMSVADQGIVNVTEYFTNAPYTIKVRATNGSTVGESAPIEILTGPIAQLELSEYMLNLSAGEVRTIQVFAKDSYNNTNTSWQPYWTIAPPNASLVQSDMNVTITAELAGLAILRCQDNVTGFNITTYVNISSSTLSRIVVTPDSIYALEGRSVQINAIGYDAFNNELDISAAIWGSQGFAMSLLMGSGDTGQLIAGMIPESGTISVTLGTIQGTAQISVIPPSWGPSLGAFPNQFGFEDISWSSDLALYWQDVNGTASLIWFVTEVNTSLLIISQKPTSKSAVDFIPQPNAFGEDFVNFWVRDSNGYTTFKNIKITVNPVNDAPEFINDPPTKMYVKFNTPYQFNYGYYVDDVDNEDTKLTLTADVSPSTYGSATSSGLILTYLFMDALAGEQYYVTATLVLSDGALQDTLSIIVWVTSDTPPELVEDLPDWTIDEGEMNAETFDLDDYFTDPDQDILYYSNGSVHVMITIDANHTVWLSSPSEWSGVESVVFMAQDPTGALQIDTINITVIPVNDRPSISAIDRIFVHYNSSFSLDLRLYVSDPDNELTELIITTSDPVNVSYSVIPWPSLTIIYPASLTGGPYVGQYEVQVQLYASDGILSSQVQLDITVSDNYPPDLNLPVPEFLSFMEDMYLAAPYSINLILLFTDIDSSELTFSIEGNGSIIVIIGVDGWANFSAPENWNGNETITFKATDDRGAWKSFKVRVDVLPVNDIPVLFQISDQNHYGGRQWSMSMLAFITDADDPTLKNIEIIVENPDFVRAVGLELYFDFPEGTDSTTVIIKVSDGDDESNTISFTAALRQTFEEMIWYPWSLFIALVVAGIIGYLVAIRMLPHKLQELFIIHNDGRLICRVGAESMEGMDEDVVSAMFTAIQEFIKDSFKDEPEGLKNLEIGDSKIIIEKGKWIYAAMIYKGWPPKSVFKDFDTFVRELEEAYGKDIQFWDGTMKKLLGIKAVSQEMLQKKYHPEAVKQEKSKAEYEARTATELKEMKAERPVEEKAN